MLKLGKNLSWDFEVIFIFLKNEVLNICQYLKSIYTYKKINNIFLKFHHYLLRADVSKYRPEVCKSEKSKILKTIHKVALGKLIT